MMEPQRLREAIASAQKGSPDAFRMLLEAYGQRLYGYFFRSTGNHHDAEDLLGEISLRLVRTLKGYDHRGRFEPWLFRIAANMVRDRIRRGRTSGQIASLSHELDTGSTLADQLPDDGPAPDAKLLMGEASLELREALERLDPASRDMVLLRHFGELSYREIAALFGCPLGTVLAKVHRGVKALRRLMGAENDSD